MHRPGGSCLLLVDVAERAQLAAVQAPLTLPQVGTLHTLLRRHEQDDGEPSLDELQHVAASLAHDGRLRSLIAGMPTTDLWLVLAVDVGGEAMTASAAPAPARPRTLLH